MTAIWQDDAVSRGADLLSELTTDLKTSGHLSIWGERGPVIIRTKHGGPPVISTMGLGTILPLFRSSTGRVFLGFMPKVATQDVLMPEQAQLDIPTKEIDTVSDNIRAKGHALIAGELVPGLCAIALPVFHHDSSLACVVTLVTTDQTLLSEGSALVQLALT